MHLIEKGKFLDFDGMMASINCGSVEKLNGVFWLVNDTIAKKVNMNIIFDNGSVGLEKIASLTCQAMNVDMSELNSVGSESDLSKTRQIITYLYTQYVTTESEALEKMFGRTDSSINYMRRQGRNLKKNGSQRVKEIISKIETMIWV
jgi:chromosomal replication initiation ATPase DnaA